MKKWRTPPAASAKSTSNDANTPIAHTIRLAAVTNERSRGVTADALDGPRNERCDVTNEEANPRDGTAADGGMLGLRRPATNRAGAARWLAIAWWSIALGVERRAVL